MKPESGARELDAFVDGELDLTSRLDLEERLGQDAGLQAQVAALRQLRETLRDGADYHAAPAALRQRMASLLASPAGAGASAGAVAVRRGPGWWALASSLALVALLGVTAQLAWWRSAHNGRLMDDVVASHVRSTLGQHLLDVASSDHHTVKPWLSSKLDFSPPVRELPLAGSALLGGRVDYLDRQPVAALVYRQGEHIVNAFVWPGTGADRQAEFGTERGFQIAHWTRGGMNHWVISDVNRQEFDALVLALQAADSAP